MKLIIAIAIVVSLLLNVMIAYGYTDSQGYELTPRLQNAVEECIKNNSPYSEFICPIALQGVLKAYVNEFCRLYESQGRNPINALVDAGLLNPIYRDMTCSEVSQLTFGQSGIYEKPVVNIDINNTTNKSSLVIRYNDMEPQLKPNDTVTYSNLTLFDNLKIGDIIVFRAPDAKTEDGKPKVIVHRVAEIRTFFEKPVLRTKGDANANSIAGTDYPIFRENYIGKVLSVTHNNNTTILAVDNQTDARTVNGKYNETAKSKVDKLIEDTKRDIAIDKAYRTEIINRIVNSTCESRDMIRVTGIAMTIEELETSLRTCIALGTIK